MTNVIGNYYSITKLNEPYWLNVLFPGEKEIIPFERNVSEDICGIFYYLVHCFPCAFLYPCIFCSLCFCFTFSSVHLADSWGAAFWACSTLCIPTIRGSTEHVTQLDPTPQPCCSTHHQCGWLLFVLYPFSHV